MGKPYGITPDLRIIRPSTAQDAIYHAVEEAIDAGMRPSVFKKEVREAWAEILKEKAELADKCLRGIG